MDTTRFATDRITLRALEIGDAGALQTYLNEPSMIGRRCIPWKMRDEAPLSSREVEEILDSWAKEKKSIALGMEWLETGELVGHAGWSWGWDSHCPTLWLAVAPKRQRQGVASEALALLLEHLFGNTPAHNDNGWFASWNEAALQFTRKQGFTETGRVPRGGLRDGAYFDDVMVDILKPEWLAMRGRD